MHQNFWNYFVNPFCSNLGQNIKTGCDIISCLQILDFWDMTVIPEPCYSDSKYDGLSEKNLKQLCQSVEESTDLSLQEKIVELNFIGSSFLIALDLIGWEYVLQFSWQPPYKIKHGNWYHNKFDVTIFQPNSQILPAIKLCTL